MQEVCILKQQFLVYFCTKIKLHWKLFFSWIATILTNTILSINTCIIQNRVTGAISDTNIFCTTMHFIFQFTLLKSRVDFLMFVMVIMYVLFSRTIKHLTWQHFNYRSRSDIRKATLKILACFQYIKSENTLLFWRMFRAYRIDT